MGSRLSTAQSKSVFGQPFSSVGAVGGGFAPHRLTTGTSTTRASITPAPPTLALSTFASPALASPTLASPALAPPNDWPQEFRNDIEGQIQIAFVTAEQETTISGFEKCIRELTAEFKKSISEAEEWLINQYSGASPGVQAKALSWWASVTAYALGLLNTIRNWFTELFQQIGKGMKWIKEQIQNFGRKILSLFN